MAAEFVKPHLKPLPVAAAAGAHAPVQQSPAARGVAEKGLKKAGKSPEEQWLAALLAVIKSKGGEPMDLSTLANPNAGGVSRPDGVAIKLVDLMKINAQRCGLVLNRESGANGYTKCTVAYDPKRASSRSSSTAPMASAAASNFQRSEQASNALGDAGEANLCNICFEEQCDTRMVPCLHKICHNCVQVPRHALPRSSLPLTLALTWRAPCPGFAYHALSERPLREPSRRLYARGFDSPFALRRPSFSQLVKESTRLMAQEAECCPFCREVIKGFVGLYATGVQKEKSSAAEGVACATVRRDTQSFKIGNKEEEWLRAITRALKAKGGKPVEYGILCNPAFGGAVRPEGVNIQLGDLLRKHARAWGFVLTEEETGTGGLRRLVALDQRSTPGNPRDRR
jgi:hypothetical protein